MTEIIADRANSLLDNWRSQDTLGKLAARGLVTTGRNFLRDILKRPGVREHLQQDFAIEGWLQTSEKIENLTNDIILTDPKCGDLRERVERSPDHGIGHFRRVEKWEKWEDEHDPETRHSLTSEYFKPAEKIAKRSHDLVEVYTGMKEGHDAAGALFALGNLLEQADVFVDLLNDHLHLQFPITREDWVNWAWATAFMCEHHSKPEKMPSISLLLQSGISNPSELLRITKNMATVYGKNDIYELFPPFKVIQPFIERIERGEVFPYLGFSQGELEALRKQTFRFAAADKLDGTFPVELAANRMILTRPERPFFTRLSNQSLTLAEELEVRISDGGGHESTCDFNRTLFELTRIQALGEFSGAVKHAFRVGLQERMAYYQRALNQFLQGNIDSFLSVYETLEVQEAGVLLRLSKVSEDDIRPVLSISEEDGRHRAIRMLLRKSGYNEQALDDVLYKIHSEMGAVRGALDRKLALLRELGLSDKEKEHILSLLNAVAGLQESRLPRTSGPAKIKLPYENYYPIDMRKWQQ